MTVTNHMMTGALIAMAVHKPILAIPLALVSHFVTDMLPHYGYGKLPFDERDSQKHFLLKQTLDTYFAVILLWLVPYLTRNVQTPLVTTWCMLMAFVPDVIWPYQYVMAKRRGTYPPLNWYTRFHKAIQWCERPWGIYVELVWFVIIALSIKSFIP
jgi:hypothetical protein